MKCEAGAIRISIDTSLLAHALLVNQQTVEALEALAELGRAEHELVGPPGMFVEFTSLLRRAIVTRGMAPAEAAAVLDDFLTLNITPYQLNRELLPKAWEIASRLGQSDTFDAMGYAVAEATDGEFWTSDRRFANAAGSAGLPRVRFVL